MEGLGQSAYLRLSGLACVRGGRLLFDGLNLALEPGEAALVMGPNGIGKSSLIRILAGLLAPAGGTVEREGALALSAEALALDPQLPLVEALRFWARLDKSGSVPEALVALDLAVLADVPVRILSTGQRKRASLARVVASGAPVWLLDEPANGLDAAAQQRLETIIAQHRAAGGIVLAASHQALALPDAQVIALGG